MVFNTFQQLIDKVRASGGDRRTVAVAAAHDEHTLEAVCLSARMGIATPLLIGEARRIEEMLRALGEKPGAFEILDAATPSDAAVEAAAQVGAGRAHFVMKGRIDTPALMRALLDAKSGMRTGRLMSHICVLQIPNRHKLTVLTDIALNIKPDLEQKQVILENAVQAMADMGFDPPKVAVLAASEAVNPKMPETLDAVELKKRNQEGALAGCLMEGPLSYDLAMSRESAAIKGLESPVCGEADLLLAPDIAAGNILAKALIYSAGAHRAGIVVGARVPVVLPSRAAEAQDKYLPLVLAASASRRGDAA